MAKKRRKKQAAAPRVRTLEKRIAAIEARLDGVRDAPGMGAPEAGGDDSDDRFWALHGLQQRTPSPGAVVFTGSVDLPDGTHVDWQWGRAIGGLLDGGWDGVADRLTALAHPVRIELLRHVLRGVHTTAALAEIGVAGTSGQLYHHLRPLVAVGWLRQIGRGRYEVPADRVVPLLVVLAAVEG